MRRSVESCFSNAEKWSFWGTQAATLYFGTGGELLKAVAIPVIGYAAERAGEYYQNATIHQVGKAVLFGTLVSLPGAGAGCVIAAIGGKTLAANAVAIVIGAGITYKATDAFLNFLARASTYGMR